MLTLAICIFVAGWFSGICFVSYALLGMHVEEGEDEEEIV